MKGWSSLRRLALFLVFAVSAGAPVKAESCDDEPDAWRRAAVARLETAYRAGLAAAATPAERRECLRIRNAGLMALVEETYASTLAWLAGRKDLVRSMQSDQARWIREVAMAESLLGASPQRMRAAQELVSRLLLERLRVLSVVTAGEAGIEEE